MAYSALFSIVFEALNLPLIFLNTFVGNGILLLSGTQIEFWLDFCHGWQLVISITSCEVQMFNASSLC
jgi:hypothetical protein